MRSVTESRIQFRPCFDRVIINVTDHCNLRCRHCYIACRSSPAHDVNGVTLASFLTELEPEFGRVTVAITGGEALTRLDDAVHLLETAGYVHDTRLTTNGTLICRKAARLLSRLPITITISIDGGRAAEHDAIRGTGAFAAAIAGLNRLLDAGFPTSSVQFSSTIMPGQLDAADSIVDLAASFGIPYIRFNTLHRQGRGKRLWDKLVNTQPEVTFLASFVGYFDHHFDRRHPDWRVTQRGSTRSVFSILHVSAEGWVYPFFPDFTNFRREANMPIGHLGKSTLVELMASPLLAESIWRRFLCGDCGRDQQSGYRSACVSRREATAGTPETGDHGFWYHGVSPV